MKVTQRGDDKQDAIVERLAVYKRQTAPLVDYYRKSGLLREVTADKPLTVDQVLANCIREIETKGA